MYIQRTILIQADMGEGGYSVEMEILPAPSGFPPPF